MLKRIGVLAMVLTAGAAILPAAAQAQDVGYRPVDRDGYRYHAQGYADSYRDRAWREHEYRERLERERRERARYEREHHERGRGDWDRR